MRLDWRAPACPKMMGRPILGNRLGAAIIGSATAIFVVLYLGAPEEDEVSKEGGWLPCFLGGECHTPKAEKEAEWRQSTLPANEEDTVLPCFLGGYCAKPRQRRVRAWKERVAEASAADLRHQQRIAARNGLPDPAAEINKDAAANAVMSVHGVQNDERKNIIEAASARVESIAMQIKTYGLQPSPLQKREAEKLERKRIQGQGLLSAGENLISILTRFPKSQKQLQGVISQVGLVHRARKKAHRLMKKAEQLQKVSKKQEKKVQLLAVKAAPSLKALRARQKVVQKARHEADRVWRKVRYMAGKVRSTRRKIRELHERKIKKAEQQMVEGKMMFEEDDELIAPQDKFDDPHRRKAAYQHAHEHTTKETVKLLAIANHLAQKAT